MDGKKVNITKREDIYLPEKIVKDSAGFSYDIGSSLIKVAYRSKEDFLSGKPILDEAIKDGRARVHLVSMPRESGAKALCDFIKESCDISKVKDTEERVKVVVTGVGNNVWKHDLETELEKPLNLKLCIAMEDYCFAEAMLTLKDSLPEEELTNPFEEEGLKGAKDYADLFTDWHGATGHTTEEQFSKMTYLTNPPPEAVKSYLPCVVCICGSGTILSMLTEKGEYVTLDGLILAGRSFLGFSEYMLGKVSFDELMSVLEASDGSTADVKIAELVDTSSDDGYGQIRNNNRRVFAFGKCKNSADRDAITPGDMVHSVFSSICENLAMSSHLTALCTGSKHIYYMGSFINIPLARKIITAEIQGKNLMRPKSQHVGFSFVRHGGHYGALGAFIKGSRPENV